jgi:hypothetical protein
VKEFIDSKSFFADIAAKYGPPPNKKQEQGQQTQPDPQQQAQTDPPAQEQTKSGRDWNLGRK